MDKETIKDTSRQIEEAPKKPEKKPEFYEDSNAPKKVKAEGFKPKESLEQFLYRKQKETGKVLTPRLKNLFVSQIKYNDGDMEKTWRGLWA